MCAWCKFRQYSGWVAEAELLFPLRYWSNVGGKLFLAPGVRLASRSVVFIAWWPPPLVFGIKFACLLKDPTVSVSVIGRFIGVAMNLARPIKYFVQTRWTIFVSFEWLLPLTRF